MDFNCYLMLSPLPGKGILLGTQQLLLFLFTFAVRQQNAKFAADCQICCLPCTAGSGRCSSYHSPLTLCPGKALWVSHSQLREPGSSVEAPHSAAWQCYRLTGTVLRDDVFVILHQNHVACYLKQEGVLHSFHQPGSCHLFSMHVWFWDLPFTRVTDKCEWVPRLGGDGEAG